MGVAQSKAPKCGKPVARVQVKPDGTVRASDPVLERTSGDEAVAKEAIASIQESIPFKPLPAQFHGPYVELRIGFASKQSLYKPLN